LGINAFAAVAFGMIERFLRACRLLLSGDQHSILLETLALRQQLAIYQRTMPRPRLRCRDRLFWMGLSRWWRRVEIGLGHRAT
jgi:hypothetical protein